MQVSLSVKKISAVGATREAAPTMKTAYVAKAAAVLLLATCIFCSYFLARFVDNSLRSADRRVHEEAAVFVAERCFSLIEYYSSPPPLVGALGFVNVTSPDVFDALSERQTSEAGISAVSLSSRVHPSLASEAATELSETYNTTIDLTYIADYDIGGDLFVLDYTYPENRGVLGLVVNSDEPRAEAVNRTLLTGDPAFLDNIILADTGEPGRVTFYPITRNHHNTIDTLFIMVIRYDAFFRPVVEPAGQVEIFVDGTKVFASLPGRNLSTYDNPIRFDSGTVSVLISSFQDEAHGPNFVYLFVSGVIIIACGAFILFLMNLSRARAEGYSALKSKFLADMSHEIRTPMNGILGTTELLADRDLDSTSRYYVNTISSCGANLMTLIEDILDMSKIEAGLLDIREDPIRVQQVIQSAVDHVWLAHKIKNGRTVGNLKLILEFAVGVPEKIVGDGVRIQQVLSNLLTNSLKFTATGYVKVVVSCFYAGRVRKNKNHMWSTRNTRHMGVCCIEDGDFRSVGNPGGKRCIRVSVRDTGSGMTTEGVKEAFGAFKKVHNATDMGGTGLGLSICKQLCGLMGGDIEICSVLNKGTTATFTIEARAPPGLHKLTIPSRNVYRHTTPGMTPGATPKAGGVDYRVRSAMSDALESVLTMSPRDRSTPPRVLVVDDVSINRKLLSNILLNAGVHADTCNNGVEAVRMSDVNKYSFVLMDMVMPKMDGVEATRRIRLTRLNRGTPVIFVSANVQPDSIVRCDASGGNGFVTKPVSKASVMEVLVMHCSPDEREHVRRHISNPPV